MHFLQLTNESIFGILIFTLGFLRKIYHNQVVMQLFPIIFFFPKQNTLKKSTQEIALLEEVSTEEPPTRDFVKLDSSGFS
jgi:hypothetical protein